MKILSICGVDGSGKTTLVKNLSSSALPVTTLRCPQYHESGVHALDALSVLFEEWSQECDRFQNPVLKAMVLFLQISLFGPMEKAQMESKPEAQFLVRERDPILDTLVYAPLYVHVLSENTPKIPENWLHHKEAQRYIFALNERFTLVPGEFSFERLREYILAFFSVPTRLLPERCLKLFQAQPATEVVILEITPTLLEARLRKKNESRDGVREYHEDTALLQKLQKGLLQAADGVSKELGFKVHVLALTEENEQQIQSLLETILLSKF